ncbi:MAG: transketolase, partial [Comamonadaceae bacterium 32-67-11]
VAWACAIERRDGPAALCLSRQNLPRVSTLAQADAIRQGGYVLAEVAAAQALIVATGSEVEIALQAQALLAAEGVRVRVVSMPCTNVFDRQPPAYQDQVLPPALPALALEAAQPDFWHKYVGRTGKVLGIATYGESAPAKDLYRHFGLTPERAADAVRALLRRSV